MTIPTAPTLATHFQMSSFRRKQESMLNQLRNRTRTSAGASRRNPQDHIPGAGNMVHVCQPDHFAGINKMIDDKFRVAGTTPP